MKELLNKIEKRSIYRRSLMMVEEIEKLLEALDDSERLPLLRGLTNEEEQKTKEDLLILTKELQKVIIDIQ